MAASRATVIDGDTIHLGAESIGLEGQDAAIARFIASILLR